MKTKTGIIAKTVSVCLALGLMGMSIIACTPNAEKPVVGKDYSPAPNTMLMHATEYTEQGRVIIEHTENIDSKLRLKFVTDDTSLRGAVLPEVSVIRYDHDGQPDNDTLVKFTDAQINEDYYLDQEIFPYGDYILTVVGAALTKDGTVCEVLEPFEFTLGENTDDAEIVIPMSVVTADEMSQERLDIVNNRINSIQK